MYLPFSKMYHIEREEKVMYEKCGSKYIGTDANEWPKLDINWDLNQDNFHLSLDGVSADKFTEDYSEGLLIGKTLIEDIYENLFYNSKIRDCNDFWKLCAKGKACGIIGRCLAKKPITPPMITPYNGTLIIVGGNHRFNVARLSGAIEIYFITPKESQNEFIEILPSVAWK